MNRALYAFEYSTILLRILSRVYIFRNEDCISENIDRESSFKSLRKYFNHSLHSYYKYINTRSILCLAFHLEIA